MRKILKIITFICVFCISFGNPKPSVKNKPYGVSVIINKNVEGAFYSHKDKAIVLGRTNGDVLTLIHEFTHFKVARLVDIYVNAPKFNSEKDMMDYFGVYTAHEIHRFTLFYENIKNSDYSKFYINDIELGKMSVEVQDIICCLTKGRIRAEWGHSEQYLQNPLNVSQEVIANLSVLYYTNNIEGLSFIERNFNKEYKLGMSLIKLMESHSKIIQ